MNSEIKAKTFNGVDKFIFQAFQGLPTREVSDELHSAIYRAAAFRRSWKYVYILTGILAVAFIFSLWHLYTRSVEVDTFSTLRAIADTFDLSMDSVADSARAVLGALPIQASILAILNLIALIFMTFVLQSFSRVQEQFKV